MTDIIHEKIESSIQLEKDDTETEELAAESDSNDVDNTTEDEDQSTENNEDGR